MELIVDLLLDISFELEKEKYNCNGDVLEDYQEYNKQDCARACDEKSSIYFGIVKVISWCFCYPGIDKLDGCMHDPNAHGYPDIYIIIKGTSNSAMFNTVRYYFVSMLIFI